MAAGFDVAIRPSGFGQLGVGALDDVGYRFAARLDNYATNIPAPGSGCDLRRGWTGALHGRGRSLRPAVGLCGSHRCGTPSRGSEGRSLFRRRAPLCLRH
jgi:hypothetical protein